MSNIKLSDHFTYRRLFRFTFSSIIMMIFTSIYTVVDGIFISNYTGTTQFAAINLIMPFLMLLPSLGLMLGSGGTALVSMKMGEGKEKEAKEIFSLIVYVTIGLAIILTIVSEIFMEKVALLLGADSSMLEYCVLYGRIFNASLVGIMLQMLFQPFLVCAERPKLGLLVTILAGVANIVLDALFVAAFKWGLVGAGVASCAGQLIGGFIPLIYFICPNKSRLKLTRPFKDYKAVVKAAGNGMSEFMSNVSTSVVNIVYNYQLMNIIGKDGVAAYGVIMYVCFIFIAVFFGYGMGTAPIVGFNYGADNKAELKNIFRKSLVIIGIAGVFMTIISEVLARPLSGIFVGYDENLLSLTVRAFVIYSFSYLLCGFNICASSFFTALNNGKVSAIISFSRLFVFQLIAVLILPLIFGTDGIWSAIIFAEILSLILTVTFIVKNRKKYGYM